MVNIVGGATAHLTKPLIKITHLELISKSIRNIFREVKSWSKG